MLRLYFNRHGELPWSIDEGPGTPERQFKDIVISGVYGEAVYEPLKAGDDPQKQPCAWIEFRECELGVGRESTAWIVGKKKP